MVPAMTDTLPRTTFSAAAIALALLLGASMARAGEAGMVAGISGAPTVTRAGAAQPLKRGDSIAVGDRISTDATARVKILLSDDSVLSIGSQTEVVIDELLLSGPSRTAKLRVLVGRFKLAIAAWFGGPTDYEIATPTAVAGVRGTVLWGDTTLDAICALSGTVEVKTVKGNANATLGAGQCVTKMAAGETQPLVPSADDLARYLKEVSLTP